MIYFVHKPSEQSIKVGYSADPWDRLKGLQTASPSPLYLLGTIPGDRKRETAWKRFFRPVGISGEWFREKPIISYFQRHLAGRSIVRMTELNESGNRSTYFKPFGELGKDEATFVLWKMSDARAPNWTVFNIYYEYLSSRFNRPMSELLCSGPCYAWV